MTESQPNAPRYRPLGLTLAIAATALTYGIIPMYPLLLLLWSQVSGRGVGTEFTGGTPGLIGVGVGVLTLAACALAWIGRPPFSRWLLLALLWIQTALYVFRIFQSLTTPPSVFGAGGTFPGSTLLICQLPLIAFVPLYVTWYLNRAPARAFYRR